jgi:hypothetical protein
VQERRKTTRTPAPAQGAPQPARNALHDHPCTPRPLRARQAPRQPRAQGGRRYRRSPRRKGRLPRPGPRSASARRSPSSAGPTSPSRRPLPPSSQPRASSSSEHWSEENNGCGGDSNVYYRFAGNCYHHDYRHSGSVEDDWQACSADHLRCCHDDFGCSPHRACPRQTLRLGGGATNAD